jgi:hypothetical protein
MRTLLLAIATLAAAVPGKAQQQTNVEGLGCFENLAVPEFPRAALQARVDGSVWTTTHVSPQGAVEKIDTEVISAWSDGQKFLAAPAEEVLHEAKVKPECAGKTVIVVFRYQLHGDATPDPKVTSRTEAPNIMYIESQPASATQTTSAARTTAAASRR